MKTTQGVMTSEFWLVLLGLVIVGAMVMTKDIQPEWTLTAIVTLIGLYTAARTATKITTKNSNGTGGE